jgi:hypothetical protein
MSEHLQQIMELRFKAWELPNCPTKVALLEEAIRIADLHNDIDEAYNLRQELMEAATFSGRIDLLLVTFAWSLAQFDRDPERFDEWDLLWKYKWVVGQAPDFPQISRKQVDEMLADMERRYTAGGHSLHAVHQMRRDVMIDLRDQAAAKDAHAKFKRAKQDYLSDCPACTVSNTGRYYDFLEKWKQAWKAYEPIVAGKLTCHAEPLRTASDSLLPLVRLGETKRALDLQQQMARRLAKAEDPIPSAADHVKFLAIVRETAKAKRLLERYLPGALDAVSARNRLAMFEGAILLLDRLAEKKGTKEVKLQTPKGLPSPDKEGRHEIAALRKWFVDEGRKIAKQYDARNGNGVFEADLDRLPELLELG